MARVPLRSVAKAPERCEHLSAEILAIGLSAELTSGKLGLPSKHFGAFPVLTVGSERAEARRIAVELTCSAGAGLKRNGRRPRSE